MEERLSRSLEGKRTRLANDKNRELPDSEQGISGGRCVVNLARQFAQGRNPNMFRLESNRRHSRNQIQDLTKLIRNVFELACPGFQGEIELKHDRRLE